MSAEPETQVDALAVRPPGWSFTDGKAFQVTAEDTKRRWGGGFWCKLCSRKFDVGDTIRWIFANGTKGQATGNFFVCCDCDGPDENVLIRAQKSYELATALAKQWGIYGPDWQRADVADVALEIRAARDEDALNRQWFADNQ